MSQDNVQFREIDGINFSTAKLPPSVAWPLKLRIGKTLGSGLNKLVKVMAIKEDANKEAAVIALLGEFLTELNTDDFMGLMVDLCKHAYKDGKKITNFDEAFADDDMTAFKVAIFVGQVNLKNFTSVVNQSALGQKLKTMTQG